MSALLSIVIPAYNESRRILPTLTRVLAFVEQKGWQAEVLVVNDGSRDDTAQVVGDFARQHPRVRLVENPGNRGKGYTVRNGVLHASGDVILFTDADLSSPIEEAPKLLDSIARGNDVAIGSRWLRSELQTERQPLLRQILGRCFNIALRLILGCSFKDTQCGFKAFTRAAGQYVFSRQLIDRWCFDPEILFLAWRNGYRIEEVPVAWAHDEGSKINPIADGMKMLRDLLRIRWNSISGRYDVAAHQVPETSAHQEPVLPRRS